MTCAIYVRLSKEDEEKRQLDSESIQNQKALLLDYAQAQGWPVVEVFCDEDYSGADRLRPAFNRMLRAAGKGRFQIILCKSQSRFTRDMELVEKYIHGLFPLWGVRFIALADNVDTAVKGNKKSRQINGLVNQWYLEDLSENVRMVLDLKRREGQYIGGVPLYGYQKDPADKNRLLVDPVAAAVVRQIFQWSLEGRGKQSIARQLNQEGVPNPTCYKLERGWLSHSSVPGDRGLWNKTTVWRILRNEMYTGVMVQGRRKKVSYKSKVLVDVPAEGWFRVEGTHEAIIDRETFRAVQEGVRLRTKSTATGQAHPLWGLVKCRDCGGAMSKTSNGGEKATAYLRCKNYAAGGQPRPCTRHAIRLDQLTELVCTRLRHYVAGCQDLSLRLPPPQDTVQEEEKQLTVQLERRRQALKNLYLDKTAGILTQEQFVELNRAFLQEQRQLEVRLARLSARAAAETEDPGDPVQALLQLETIPRDLAARLIDTIEIGEKDPETGEQEVVIHWSF